MNKKVYFSLIICLMCMLVSFQVFASEVRSNPIAISPGNDSEIATISQTCPTFSWTSVDQAVSYRIAVFEVTNSKVLPYQDMAVLSTPIIQKDITGPAFSWTLSSEKSLKSGSQYVWYVQALDDSNNVIGDWSSGKIFKVEKEIYFVGVEEKLREKLKVYGVNDETISKVLNDMKSEVKEINIGYKGSKKTDIDTKGLNLVRGFEGNGVTCFGLNTTNMDTTGTNLSLFGYNSGRYLTTGFNNTFMGAYAGYATTTGHGNTFIGSYAGYNNVTGYYNTVLGYHAGMSLDQGSENIVIGHQAGRYATTGGNNILIGKSAGYNSGEGSGNIAIGSDAGYYNTNICNIFLGGSAGRNSTGDSNIYVGGAAALRNTTGCNNVAIGEEAGYNNITGNRNVFFGYMAGYYEAGSDKLYIANSSTTNPLIYGDFATQILKIHGKLGVDIVPAYPIHTAAGAYCSTGGVWTNASSRALKENIEGLDSNEAIDTLNNLNPVKYNYKVDKTDKHVGFIAEDVPELVATGDRKGLSAMDVTAVLTKVVQEQQKIIKDLQERLERLEKK